MSFEPSNVSTKRKHYYSCSQGPFDSANNIYMFYGGAQRGEIAETIVRSLRVDSDLITVHGERGSGKTLLSLVLADRLKHRYNIIRYDLPRISRAMLLRHLLIELCPEQAEVISPYEAVEGASAHLLELAWQCIVAALNKTKPSAKPCVLMVDTHAMVEGDVLQMLNDLADVQRAGEPAIHVIHFKREEETPAVDLGNDCINLPQHHYWLRRLSFAEVQEYLHHHMLLFDFNQRAMFSSEMAYFIADRSAGVLRSINTLARNAFMIAGLEDSERVSMSHLLMAGLPPREPEHNPQRFFSRHRFGLVAMLGTCVVLSAGAALVTALA